MEPAKKLEDLVVWQLASRLAELVERMIDSPRARRYRKLCNQIRESSDSTASNLAEGYGRYYPSENAPYVRIAKASLIETRNHLLVGERRRCWKTEDFEQAWRLSCRALKAIVPYLLYLEQCEGAPGESEQPRKKNRNRRTPQRGPRKRRKPPEEGTPDPST